MIKGCPDPKCRYCVCSQCGGNNDDYMVHDHVWASAGFEPRTIACIRCLEKALGRQICVSDFTLAPINDGRREGS